MSFLLIALKKETSANTKWPILNNTKLAAKLCPYNLPLKWKNWGEQVCIYYNDFSKLTVEEFLTPANHKCEPNSAWTKIQFKNENLKLQTDPLGQCPIWIIETEDYFGLSPELKSFSAIVDFKMQLKEDDYYLKVKRRKVNESDFENVKKLPPAWEVLFNYSNLRLNLIEKTLPWHEGISSGVTDLKEAQDLLTSALEFSAKDLPIQKVGSLLSGGIDSSVATCLAKQRTDLETTFNLKTELGSEERESQETSAFLGLKSKTLLYPSQQTSFFFESVIHSNELTDGLTTEILLQMKAVIDLLPPDLENIVTGYGADLLFGGMLGHQAYMQVTGTSDTESLLDRAYWSKELTPFYYWAQGKRLFNLFWHPFVIKAALQIPLSLQQIKAEKYVLRSLAVRNQWLTEALAFRKKTGMTNGTNINFILSKNLNLANEYEYEKKNQISLSHFKSIFL